jgi:hypothetical protein
MFSDRSGAAFDLDLGALNAPLNSRIRFFAVARAAIRFIAISTSVSSSNGLPLGSLPM